MGQLKHDGRATLEGVTWPAGVITFGDFYSVSGWNGFAMNNVAAADTDRVGAMEIAPDRIWYVKVPAALVAAKGAYLYWANGAGVFQRGDTDLVATPATAGDAPVAIVEEAVDANDYCAIRALNVGPVAA
jgi:hypothetical protein